MSILLFLNILTLGDNFQLCGQIVDDSISIVKAAIAQFWWEQLNDKGILPAILNDSELSSIFWAKT